jgi:flagellar biosynthesis GTPase FlhF
MRTKTFRGESVQAVIQQVRDELGGHGIILNTLRKEESVIEIEVELVSLDGQGSENGDELASLDESAEMARETDAPSALILNRLSRDVQLICRRYLAGEGHEAELLARGLGEALSFDTALPPKARAVALIGPSGAGKTTTIAKLIAHVQAVFDTSVGIIITDPVRSSHEMSLETYAQIVGVPSVTVDCGLDVRQQIPEAIARLRDCELIFIDTPGVGAREENRLRYIELLLDGCHDLEAMWVMPASHGERELSALTSAYRRFDCSRIILTKVDQAGYLGPAINEIHRSGLPLGFVTGGGRVSDEIEPASARRLAWLLLRQMH